LAGDGDVGLGDDQAFFQRDRAGDAKDHGPLALADRIAERAGTGVIEVGHFIDFAAAAAGRLGAKALGPGKGGKPAVFFGNGGLRSMQGQARRGPEEGHAKTQST
jgi:hypothetical protein